MNRNGKRIIRIALISIFFLGIVFYAYYRSRDLIFGVTIRNVNLVDGATMPAALIKVTGNAKNATFLSLDDREISINEQGDFSEDVALLPGYNIITLKAKDKFGNADEKDYKLMLAPQ
ncbi:MAG: hypothetical protein WDN09_00135 [bacterium]